MQPAMTCHRGLVTPALLVSILVVGGLVVGGLVAGGCGDSSNPGQTADSATAGSWLVAGQTIGGSATAPDKLDGTAVIGATDFAFATADPLGGILTSYTLGNNGTSMVLRDGTNIGFTLAPSQLTLQLTGDRTAVLAPEQAAAVTTISVKGTVTAPAGTASFVAPTAALMFLTRANPGFIGDDGRNYQTITFKDGKATFDFEIARGALGTERIVFGPQEVAVAIGFVVIFDDRETTSTPGTLANLFQACPGTSTSDCVLGISPFLLGYRSGDSKELAASPYAYLHSGWSQAIIVTDARGGGTKSGLLSLDTAKTLAFDITLWDDPSAHSVPKLDLTSPTGN